MNTLAAMMRRPRTFADALPNPDMLPERFQSYQPPEGDEAMEFGQNELLRRIMRLRALGADI
jgi:hypothetical protein